MSLFTDRNASLLPTAIRREANPQWRLHLLLDGELEIATPAGSMNIKGGEATLMRPDDSYQVGVISPQSTLWLVTADFAVMPLPGWSDPLRRLRQPAVVSFREEASLRAWARGIPSPDDRESAILRRPAVDFLLSSFLSHGFSHKSLTLESGDMPRWLSDLRREITQKGHLFDPDTNLRTMARIAGLSREHLCREFRQHMRCTPMEWIHRERITNACRAMIHGDLERLTDIALKCGYRSPSQFCRHFKKVVGCSASEWRQSHSSLGIPSLVDR